MKNTLFFLISIFLLSAGCTKYKRINFANVEPVKVKDAKLTELKIDYKMVDKVKAKPVSKPGYSQLPDLSKNVILIVNKCEKNEYSKHFLKILRDKLLEKSNKVLIQSELLDLNIQYSQKEMKYSGHLDDVLILKNLQFDYIVNLCASKIYKEKKTTKFVVVYDKEKKEELLKVANSHIDKYGNIVDNYRLRLDDLNRKVKISYGSWSKFHSASILNGKIKKQYKNLRHNHDELKRNIADILKKIQKVEFIVDRVKHMKKEKVATKEIQMMDINLNIVKLLPFKITTYKSFKINGYNTKEFGSNFKDNIDIIFE